MKKNCTISIIHETRYVRTEDVGLDEKDRKYPVKIRATFKINSDGKAKWIQKYFPTGHDLTEREFESAMGSPRTPELKEARQEILELQQKALNIIKDNFYMTPQIFANQFTGSGNLKNVIDFMKMLKNEYYEAGRIGTGDTFKDAISSISDFVNPERKREKRQDDEPSVWLSFVEVDEEWLNRYEAWAIRRGNSINTIGMYLRNLRRAFNVAMSKKYRIISPDIYPFGLGGYKIKKQSKTKWAPEPEEKQDLFSYTPKDKDVLWALDMGKFSYYMNGSNPADIAHLKAGVFLSGADSFELDRRKTSRTEQNKKLIPIHIHPDMRAIWQRWGNKTLNPNEYAFPILIQGQNPQQQQWVIEEFIYEVNKGLDVVGKAVKLKKKLTFGIFRHIFSTTLKRQGVDITDRQHAMGHDSPQTTQNYDHSFNQDKAKELSSLL